MVRGCVPAGPRELEEVVERRRRLDELRLLGPAASHRHDHDAAVSGEDPSYVPGHGGLPDPLAEADHGERRRPNRVEGRRIEAEVRTHVRQPERERAGRPQQSLPRPQDGLVGEVDDELRADRVEGVDQ